MSNTLIALFFPALLLAQKSPFSISASQPVTVTYDVPTPLASIETGSIPVVVVKSAQAQTYQITSSSNPQWLQYAVASSADQDCSQIAASAYRSGSSVTATGATINLCIRGFSAPSLAHGNYLGTITVGPSSGLYFVPFRFNVKLQSFPTAFLQLSVNGGVFFGGGTINLAVQPLTLSFSTVLCNVSDPNNVNQVDLKNRLQAAAFVPGTNTAADWVNLSLSNNGSSPANLSISIDPVKALNQPDLSAVVVINSSSPNASQDFVSVQPDVVKTIVPALTASPNPINMTAVAGSTTPVAQSVSVSANAASAPFTVSASTNDGNNWLSVPQPNGTTGGTFTLAVDASRLAAKTYTGTVTVTSPGLANSPLAVPVNVQVSPAKPAPLIALNGVVNAASNTRPIAPGSWVTIYGDNLSPNAPGGLEWSNAIANGKLPFVLGGVSVTINNIPAAVSFVNNGQINLQAPNDSSRGTVNVVVTNSNGVSAPGVVILQTVAPALFMSGSTAIPAAQLPDFSTITANHPAHPSDSVILYGTGFGPTNPATATGVVLSGAAPLTNPVTATVGNLPATVDFAGIIGAGLYQINIRVPAAAGNGNQPLILTINGLQTQLNAVLPVSR